MGMDGITAAFQRLADLAGSLVCHQLADRSFIIDGRQLPVCARDTGIYLGIFVSAAFVLLSGRLRSDRPPNVRQAAVLCILMLPMLVDGVGSYLGMYVTNNTARLLTGVLFGVPIPLFLTPLANFEPAGRNERAVLRDFGELAGILAAALLFSFLILKGYFPYLAAAVLFPAALLFLLGRISYTVVSMSLRSKRVYRYLLSAAATLCALLALYLLSSLVLQPLKAVFYG